MKYYSLLKLILFWKEQSLLEFEAIHEVLDIIDDNNIPEEAKFVFLMRTLRSAGLIEEGYEAEIKRDLELTTREIAKDKEAQIEYFTEETIIPLQHTGKIRILNAYTESFIIMN